MPSESGMVTLYIKVIPPEYVHVLTWTPTNNPRKFMVEGDSSIINRLRHDGRLYYERSSVVHLL